MLTVQNTTGLDTHGPIVTGCTTRLTSRLSGCPGDVAAIGHPRTPNPMAGYIRQGGCPSEVQNRWPCRTLEILIDPSN